MPYTAPKHDLKAAPTRRVYDESKKRAPLPWWMGVPPMSRLSSQS